MTTILRRSGRRYVIALALALLAFALSPALGDTRPALFLLGLIVGLVSRDIALFAHFLRVWPATEAVINWARVDELLGEAPGDAA